VRANVLHRRILTILPFLMVIVPRSALSDANVMHVSRLIRAFASRWTNSIPMITTTAFRRARSTLCFERTTVDTITDIKQPRLQKNVALMSLAMTFLSS